jgi:hypothetical protein
LDGIRCATALLPHYTEMGKGLRWCKSFFAIPPAELRWISTLRP